MRASIAASIRSVLASLPVASAKRRLTRIDLDECCARHVQPALEGPVIGPCRFVDDGHVMDGLGLTEPTHESSVATVSLVKRRFAPSLIR